MTTPRPRSVLLLGAILVLRWLAAPAVAADAGHLTPDDYVAIQQLDAKYAFAIENCTNSGYDYADLYVPDGDFGVVSDWGATSGPGAAERARCPGER